MEPEKTFFSKEIKFQYSCFDRIVINCYILHLLWEANVVHFFKKVNNVAKITKEVMQKRTTEYKQWVESYAKNRKIPIVWAEKENGRPKRKEDQVLPFQKKAQKKSLTGVYYIIKSQEQGLTFRIFKPKYPVKDENHMILKRMFSRYQFYYFYLLDPVLGPMSLKIGTFFPFPATAYINGHSYIAESLKKKHAVFHKEDNAFLSSGNPGALQKVAESLSPEIITKQLDSWLFLLGPNFSKHEREEMNLNRSYSIAQIEYCKNIIFNRHFPLTRLFQTTCQHGLLLLQATSISRLFGRRITRRFKGKLQHILEKSQQGYFVLRSYFKNGMVKQYVKHSNYLRTEVTSNNLYDLKIKKSISNLPVVRETFSAIAENYLQHQTAVMRATPEVLADETLSKPVLIGKTRIPGIRIEDKRMHRVMETLLHLSAAAIPVSNSRVYERLLEMYHLSEAEYPFSKLRYDMRKLRAHGIVERIGKTYTYRLTEAGVKISASMVILYEKIFVPALSGHFMKTAEASQIETPLLKTYKRLDNDLDKLFNLFNRAA
jgi:hypothetical protein